MPVFRGNTYSKQLTVTPPAAISVVIYVEILNPPEVVSHGVVYCQRFVRTFTTSDIRKDFQFGVTYPVPEIAPTGYYTVRATIRTADNLWTHYRPTDLRLFRVDRIYTLP